MDLECYTSSNGAKLKDVAAVQRLCEQYHFEVEPDQRAFADGAIGFWGYEVFAVNRPVYLDGNGNEITDPAKFEEAAEVEIDYETDSASEFFERLQSLLADTLVVQCVGHEGLRFPLVAYQVTVPPEGPIKWDAFHLPKEGGAR